MQQVISLWNGLEIRQRIMAVAMTLLVFVGVLLLSRAATAPNYQLLYSGLESNAAGEIVRSLQQEGVPYRVRGDAIYVDADHRDSLRMTLAAEGLPANGGRGYELLDNLSGFGTTSQMFDAAYWRAKEGELARTIVASPHISAARVHIANGIDNAFGRAQQPTASVTISAASGRVSAAQANALRFLVSSAVAGMAVEDVTVIDTNGTVLGSIEAGASEVTELDRADALKARVQRLLEARVGPGNAIVEVSVDTVSQRETIRETRFDPKGRVAISTEVIESVDSSSGQGGAVTVASNLPDGDAASSGNGNSQASETRERTNYEVSQTEKQIEKGPGDIKRITVAVLVNKLNNPAADGPDFVDRPDEELADLEALVASAVGYDEARGDVITLRSMELPSIAQSGSVPASGFLNRFPIDLMQLVKMAIIAVVTLILALFVLRPILINARGAQTTPALDSEAPQENAIALDSELVDEDSPIAGADRKLAALSDSSAEPVERLRHMIGERQEETVEILRSWLEEEAEKA